MLQQKALELDPSFADVLKSGLPPKEMLAEIHFHSMKLMLEYFNYCSALTKHILITRKIGDKRSSAEFIKMHFGGRKTDGECQLIAFELSSLHELAVLRHREIKEVCGIDLKDDDTLRKYVYDNVNRMLGD